MPEYGVHPPLALQGGQVVKAFDAETPANGVASQAYALPPNIDEISVSIYYAAAPAPTDYKIQVADEDVAALYKQISQSTDVNGEEFTITTAAKFIRVLKTGQTGGGAVTVSFSPRRRT